MNDPTTTPCTRFEPPNSPPLLARFDLPDSSSDGGAALLPACNARFGPEGLTDFPMLLAPRRSSSPSILLLRAVNEFSPAEHAALILTNLPTMTDDLRQGAAVSLGPDRARVRSLPLR